MKIITPPFSKNFRTSLILSLLGVIWFVFLKDALLGERLFSLYEDNEFMLGPIFAGISRLEHYGALPLRLDSILGGFPLYNFTQITPYYPFYGFWLDDYNAFFPTLKTLNNITLFHLLLLLVNMYYLLRKIGSDTVAAIAGAVLFTFGADMYSYAIWVNIIAPYSWLPLYIAGIIGILKRESIRLNYALVMLSVCMIVTASPSQPLIHAVLITAFILLAYFICKIYSGAFSDGVSGLFRVFIIAVICGLICAPVIISASTEAHKMIRWIGEFPAIFLNERIPFDAFIKYKLPLKDVWRLFYHRAGGLVGGAYIGFFVVPLIFFAFLRKASWLSAALLATACYSLFSAFGDDLGLAYLNHEIPLLNKIREPSRNLALFHLCVAMLAALGMTNIANMLRKDEAIGSRGAYLLVISGLIVSVAFIYGFLRFGSGAYVKNVFGGFHYTFQLSDYFKFAVFIFLIIITGAAFHFRSVLLRPLVIFGWPVAAIIGLFTTVSWQPPFTISDSVYVRNNLASLEMAILDVSRRNQSSDYRVLFDGDIDKGQAAMLAAYHGVRSFTYYINPAPIRQAVDFEWHGYTPYYSYQGAGYLICRHCDIKQYSNFKLLSSYGEYQVFSDSLAYPRIYAADVVGTFSDTRDFANKINGESQNGFRHAYIDGSPAITYLNKANNLNGCRINRLKESPIQYELLVDCAQGIVIVLNEYNDGNWVAKINGRETTVLRVNANQNGVVSTGGTQFITFIYRPVVFFHSIYLTLIGILCFVVLIYFDVKYGRQRAEFSEHTVMS